MASDLISFARGAPSADILPVEAVRKAAASALEDDWERALSYGKGEGHRGLVEWIAERHSISPAQVMVTNGSLEAGAMLFEHLLEPGDRVIVEQPSYDRTLLLLGRLGVELVPVALEADGLDVGVLESVLKDGPVKLAHLIPNFHNPAGCTLSASKRERVLELATEHGFWVFEDDPYRELPFEQPPPQTMLSNCGSDQVIHASSFSKTVAPGLRVGWYILPSELAGSLIERANATYITPVLLGQAVVYEFIRRGSFEPNLVRVNGLLKERRDAMLAALEKHFAGSVWSRPEGGYFIWLELPSGMSAKQVLDRAEGVTAVLGTDFGGNYNTIRLAYSYVSPEEIDVGIERLAAAVAAQADEASQTV